MNYAPNYVLKQRAKEQLSSNLGTVIGAFLLHMLCLVPVAFIMMLLPDNSFFMLVIVFIVNILWDIYSSIFLTGENYVALTAAVRRTPMPTDVFMGFRGLVSKITLIRIVPALLRTVAYIPVSIVYQRFTEAAESMDMDTFMLSYYEGDFEKALSIIEPIIPLEMMMLVLGIVYFIICIIISIAYSQTLFIIHDYPNITAGEMVSLGFKVMKGQWGRYLYMQCSFILWDLASFVTCGLSTIWVYPYKRIAYAEFYLDIMKGYRD